MRIEACEASHLHYSDSEMNIPTILLLTPASTEGMELFYLSTEMTNAQAHLLQLVVCGLKKVWAALI